MERIKFILTCMVSLKLLIICVNAIETPEYTVVYSESDFEIRLYRESCWMSALVRGISFEKSTKEGFHRLYQYIHGANRNSSQVPMTAPVLTSVFPAEHGFEYVVRLYISSKYEGTPPQPNPELNLELQQWKIHCAAVRKFSGFARDDNINKETEALLTSLDNLLRGTTAVLEDKSSFTIAQYNASHHLSERLNEVWMNISGFPEGCPSY